MITKLTHRVVAPVAAVALLLGNDVVPTGVHAQGPHYLPAPTIEEHPGAYTGFTFVAPPAHRSLDGETAMLEPSPSFAVTYIGFSPEAREAFQYAVNIWGGVVQTAVPIRITAYWRTDLPAYVVGAAGASVVMRDFANAPRTNTYYPVALANARAQTDLYSGDDIVASFNGNFDWYLDTDGNARTQLDLVSVVLHEIGHGLGLFGSYRVDSGGGFWGFGAPAVPLGYDAFVKNGTGRSLLDTAFFPMGSTQLTAQLISGDLHFDGAATRLGYEGSAPRLFAPGAWQGGSSVSHLDDASFPIGSANSLMTPGISPGEVIHDPGPIVRGMLKDLGWALVGDAPPPATSVSTPKRLRIIGS